MRQSKTATAPFAFHSVGDYNSVKASLRNSVEVQTPKLHHQSALSVTKLIQILTPAFPSLLAPNSGRKISGVIYQRLRQSLLTDSLLHYPLRLLHASPYLLNSAALPARFPLRNVFRLFLMLGNCVHPRGLPSSTEHRGLSWMWLCGSFHPALSCSFSIYLICPAKLYPHTTMPSTPTSSPSSHDWASSSGMMGDSDHLHSSYGTCDKVCQKGARFIKNLYSDTPVPCLPNFKVQISSHIQSTIQISLCLY